MTKTSLTESESNYDGLEKMDVITLLTKINQEDKKVAPAVEKIISHIEKLVNKIVLRMKKGGRLFYIGAGTSGRLGIVDASECPPTFGVPDDVVIGIIAGGDKAIRKAVEFAEDDKKQGWKDLLSHKINMNDSVIGIAASGSTPYVIGAINEASKNGILTGCITCNKDTTLAKISNHPIEVLVDPEFITASTRMKAGTSQKLILNMISTAVMIQLGHVEGNKMVDMQVHNRKLINRAIKMLTEKLDVSHQKAEALLKKHGSVKAVLNTFK